ncbi:SusC/RagA family protein [Niabella ginsenosidivorans]|uniref:SusC/RagA family protein n=1 Tax=Niabella ginsenosidivorans TaxID=1176587 RepID=A0A1A9I2Z7_9BACT|nr:TonB-dependent receptor [Niabella ginsenosidivorans]ANH81061.1 SusC/RagA family protein [Niabella ginsenosidivorans]
MKKKKKEHKAAGAKSAVFPRFIHFFMLMGLLSGLPVQAQTLQVTGTVTNEENEPLIGVNVSVKGAQATTTDSLGHYSIPVPKGSLISFSHTGYGSLEKEPAGSVLDVQLQSSSTMMEEVQVGYTRLRKSDLTGAVSSVKASELNLSSPTVSQALVGKVAGVQVSQVSGAPNSGTKIRVRGVGSINASSEPLYVIDGYPMGGNISSGPGNSGNSASGYNPNTSNNDIFINPEDIESIEILKDAASAAIYGSRAAAGVVLITTKRGKEGKGKFEYDYQVGINQLEHKVKLLDADGFARLFVDGRNLAYRDILVAKGIQWNDAFYSDDNATRVAKAGASNAASVTMINSLYDFANQKALKSPVNTDWQDELYRNALNQRHNISFSGGNKSVRYMLSAGYQNQDGIIISTNMQKINLRANIDADISKKFKVGTNIFVTNTNSKEVEEGRFDHGAILAALVYMPIFPVYNDDGSLALGLPSQPIDGYTHSFQGIENPVALATKIKITRKGTRGTYGMYGQYEILPDLNAKINLNAQTYTEKYDYYYPTDLSSGANPPNSAQAIAAANATAEFLDTKDVLGEFTLNYKRQFSKHSFDVLAGSSAQQGTQDIVAVNAKGFSNNYIPEITAKGAEAANFTLIAPTGKSTTTMLSYFSRVIYNYDRRYFLMASYRRDASSRFGSENRWGQFPSVSAGWALSNEDFYHDWLGEGSSLKLRASWGLTGNNNIGNYNYEQAVSSAGGAVIGGTVYNSIAVSNIADPKLGWESTSSFNFGLDAALLKSRLFVILNYYLSKSYDLLYNQSISALSGFTTIMTNLPNSNIRNKGFDLQMDARIIQKRDFNLGFSGNITANRNKVVSLGSASELYAQGAERPYNTHVTRVGAPVGMFYGLTVAGMVREKDMPGINADRQVYLANGNKFPAGYKLAGVPISTYSSTPLGPGDLYFVDKNGDGVINDNDKDIIGTPYPDFTYGFNVSANYKRIDFSASFNGSQGNQVLDGQDYYIRNFEGSGNNYAVTDNRYRSEAEPGDGHEYRASRGGTQSNSTRLSTFYLQDGSFFRCTNISLGYTFNTAGALKRAGISGLRWYVGVDNAFTITKYLGYNPEVDYNDGQNYRSGVDYGKYPLVRAYNTGIKVQF